MPPPAALESAVHGSTAAVRAPTLSTAAQTTTVSSVAVRPTATPTTRRTTSSAILLSHTTASGTAATQSTTSAPAAKASAATRTSASARPGHSTSETVSDAIASSQTSASANKGSSNHTGVIVAVVAVVAVLLLFVLAVLLFRRRKTKARKEKINLLYRRSDAWQGGVYHDSPSVVSSKSMGEKGRFHDQDDGAPETFPWRSPPSPAPYAASNYSINSSAPLMHSLPDTPGSGLAPNGMSCSPAGHASEVYEVPQTAPLARKTSVENTYPPPPAAPLSAHSQSAFVQSTHTVPPTDHQLPDPYNASNVSEPLPNPYADQDQGVGSQEKGSRQYDSLMLPGMSPTADAEELSERASRPFSGGLEQQIDSFPAPPMLIRQDSSMARPVSHVSLDSSMARPISFGEATHPDTQSPLYFPETPTTGHQPSTSGHSNESPLPSATFTIPSLPKTGDEVSPTSTVPPTPALSRETSVQKPRSVTPSLPPLEQRHSGAWTFLDDLLSSHTEPTETHPSAV